MRTKKHLIELLLFIFLILFNTSIAQESLKIFNVLDSLSKQKQLKAKDIMNKKLISVDPETDIKEVRV